MSLEHAPSLNRPDKNLASCAQENIVEPEGATSFEASSGASHLVIRSDFSGHL